MLKYPNVDINVDNGMLTNSSCLMYELCMFKECPWKMYVVVRTSVCVCKLDKFLRDRVFDNNEVYNHLFKV